MLDIPYKSIEQKRHEESRGASFCTHMRDSRQVFRAALEMPPTETPDGDEETEASGIFVITGRGKAIQWRVTRKLLGSICEINEFHNALTTFTVKTKSRLRGWIGIG